MDLPTTDAPLVTAVPQAVQQDDQAIGGKTDGDKLMKAELARPLHYLIGESKDDECFAAEEMKTEADELQAAGEEKKAEEKMKGDEQAEEKNDEDEDTASRSQDYQDNEALVSRLLAETDETDFEDSDDREFELNGRLAALGRCKKVSSAEYIAFYTTLTSACAPPLCVQHLCITRHLEFRALLFAPSKVGRIGDLQWDYKGATRNNLGHFLAQSFWPDLVDLTPIWLHSVTGHIDSDAIPANTARNSLQQYNLWRWMKKCMVRSCLALFADAYSKGDLSYARMMNDIL